MPMVLGSERSPYSDTPTPKCFGTVSPLDPQIFSTIVEYVNDLLAGKAEREVFADGSGAVDGRLMQRGFKRRRLRRRGAKATVADFAGVPTD